jgi:hypothetical protein
LRSTDLSTYPLTSWSDNYQFGAEKKMDKGLFVPPSHELPYPLDGTSSVGLTHAVESSISGNMYGWETE